MQLCRVFISSSVTVSTRATALTDQKATTGRPAEKGASFEKGWPVMVEKPFSSFTLVFVRSQLLGSPFIPCRCVYNWPLRSWDYYFVPHASEDMDENEVNRQSREGFMCLQPNYNFQRVIE